ncbi:MAG: hypothetical protein ACTSWY_04210, partial [Promethearchaeota archaeon]
GIVVAHDTVFITIPKSLNLISIPIIGLVSVVGLLIVFKFRKNKNLEKLISNTRNGVEDLNDKR